MTGELTVADIATRLGLRWPADECDHEPRHLLAEAEPAGGELTAFWFGPSVPSQQAGP